MLARKLCSAKIIDLGKKAMISLKENQPQYVELRARFRYVSSFLLSLLSARINCIAVAESSRMINFF